jgi:hypothetical protein
VVGPILLLGCLFFQLLKLGQILMNFCNSGAQRNILKLGFQHFRSNRNATLFKVVRCNTYKLQLPVAVDASAVTLGERILEILGKVLLSQSTC